MRTVETLGVLTNKEIEVLRWYSHGLTAVMIADVMNYSRWWVVQTTANARYKLQAKNTAHAVANAIRAGLLA